ncbi:hypothetical protein NMY22_g19765 [Coprinellus aureogranulatus]|nr:hypothetical protein NMY22_g19765 [Coprinellus aureogranulatus]
MVKKQQDSALDPLDEVTAPPIDETDEQREERLRHEHEAKAVSDAIDEKIEEERVAEKKGPKPVKILLLGQSESGKSTTLKNFQLMYEPKAFRRERASWRAVIQLNVVRSFHVVMDAITRSVKASHNLPHAPTFSSLGDVPEIPVELLERKARLAPLLAIEKTLIQRLTPVGSGETEATQLRPNREIAVNSMKPWKAAFGKLMNGGDSETSEDDDGIDWDDPDDPGPLLNHLSADMIALWNDPTTQRILRMQNIRMEEVAGFFLDQLEIVTAARYIPSDDDILKARLKTLGVTEHRFTLSGSDFHWSSLSGLSRDWRIFDVGGHRSQRAAWVPYFDDMNTIIFLAPISCFDQTLAEDSRVNRLADSVSIWSDVCRNELLKKTDLIVFLNKVDIFRTKIQAGIRLRDYIVSYGNRPNDFENTTGCECSSSNFLLPVAHALSSTVYEKISARSSDPKSTSFILASLKDMIVRGNLAKTDLAMGYHVHPDANLHFNTLLDLSGDYFERPLELH